MTDAQGAGLDVHLLLFPADLGAAEPLEEAIREGARAVTLEIAGFMRPAGLASVALACADALDSGVSIATNRSRSPAADSYLERVGFYDLVRRHGGIVSGTSRSAVALEPLTGLSELADRGAAERQIAECLKSLGRFGIRQADAQRIDAALRAALDVLSAGEQATIFVAERYADEAGWTRLEIGMGTLHASLGRDDWSRLDRALLAWKTQRGLGPGPFERLVAQALSRGPGALELRSGHRISSSSTRSGSSGRTGTSVIGTRLGLIFNVEPPEP